MAEAGVVGTEAELQARLAERIRAALPLLPVGLKIERYLHLRLGHHEVVIDGFKSDRVEIIGRYDVLVLLEDRPLLIAELKAPHVAITDDDVAQALSYARAHQPIVPLILVTNGASTTVRRSYDGEELQASDVSAERLSSVLSAAASLAASDSENAIRTLLGTSTEVWHRILWAWSEEAIVGITGSLRDFSCPLSRELTIPRTAVKEVERLLAGSRVIILHGPPLSGVTNTLAQLVQNGAISPALFVDAKTTPDVLQYMSNRLSRELSFGVSKDDLRVWLNTRCPLVDLTIVIDGLPRDGVDELCENANAGLMSLVIGMDSETYRRNSAVRGSIQQSLHRGSAVALDLRPLSDDEFYGALKVFDKSFGAVFFNGAQHVPELRWPRRLRVLAGQLPGTTPATPETGLREKRFMLAPIQGPTTLGACRAAFGLDPVLKFDLQKLAEAFLVDAGNHVGEPSWLIATWGQPSIDPGILEETCGPDRVGRLCERGYLSWIDSQGLGPRLLVCVEEVLTDQIAEQWSSSLARLQDPDDVVSALGTLLSLTMVIPSGEVALAAAIKRSALKNRTVLGAAIPYLLNNRPVESRLTEGAQVEVLGTNRSIPLHFGEGMDEKAIGNLQPWLVLSHLASWPMAAEGSEGTANLSIFAELGASHHLLYQPRPTELAKVPGFHFHDMEGIGSVLCMNTGIVEPLSQAMLDHAHRFPDEMIVLARHAMEKKEVHLAWRILTVALATITSTKEEVRQAAEVIKEVLGEWWGDVLKNAIKERKNNGS